MCEVESTTAGMVATNALALRTDVSVDCLVDMIVMNEGYTGQSNTTGGYSCENLVC